MLSAWITLTVLHWAVLLSPGVNFILVSQLAASGGARAAKWAAVGISLTTLMWACMAAMGAHAVFAAHPKLHLAVRCLGAGYLLYLAWKMWPRAMPMLLQRPILGATTASGRDQPNPASAFAALRLGFITNVLNPKSALFFASVFMAALPANSSKAVVIAAVALVWFYSLAWHLGLALVFAKPAVQTAYRSSERVVARLAAAALAAIGLKQVAGIIFK